MCNCVCVCKTVHVCVLSMFCLKDCIHCSLIRDIWALGGLKILQSLCVVVCVRARVCVFDVSLVPHFTSLISVFISNGFTYRF